MPRPVLQTKLFGHCTVEVVLTPTVLSKSDMDQLEAIELECEKSSESFTWTTNDFIGHIVHKRCHFWVVRNPGREIVGYLAVMVQPRFQKEERKKIRQKTYDYGIVNLKIAPKYQRQGLGSNLIRKLIESLNRSAAVIHIVTQVWETNIIGAMFLKHLGFRCVGLLPAEVSQQLADEYGLDSKRIEHGRYCFEYLRDTTPDCCITSDEA